MVDPEETAMLWIFRLLIVEAVLVIGLTIVTMVGVSRETPPPVVNFITRDCGQ